MQASYKQRLNYTPVRNPDAKNSGSCSLCVFRQDECNFCSGSVAFNPNSRVLFIIPYWTTALQTVILVHMQDTANQIRTSGGRRQHPGVGAGREGGAREPRTGQHAPGRHRHQLTVGPEERQLPEHEALLQHLQVARLCLLAFNLSCATPHSNVSVFHKDTSASICRKKVLKGVRGRRVKMLSLQEIALSSLP